MSEYLVGLDIGTSNVRCAIAEYDADNDSIKFLGLGEAPSTGLRSGVIVNIDATMRSVTAAIEKAEMMAGHEVTSLICGIGGSQVDSLNSTGQIAVFSKDRRPREITQNDIERVIEAARAVVIPMDRFIIHIIPRTYTVDKQGPVKDPINMLATRLDVDVNIITAVQSSAQNFNKCIMRSGYEVQNLMSKTLAESVAVVTEEEQDLGSILIDLGGGSTDVIVFLNGAPIYSTSIPIGGITVTNDISIVRGISTDTAEEIKIKHGCCWDALVEDDETVLIPGVGGRPPEEISRHEITAIIQPRIEEILNMVRQRINQQTKLTELAGNVVLTGGGALMSGIIEIACDVFKTTAVRIGMPANFGDIKVNYRSPEYATVAGLIVANCKKNKSLANTKSSGSGRSGTKNSFWKSVGNFFKEFF